AAASGWSRLAWAQLPALLAARLPPGPVCAGGRRADGGAPGRCDGPQGRARAALRRCPMEPWRPWLAAAGLDWPEPARGVWLVDLGMMLAAARAGQGIALTRRTLAAEWLDEGKLLRVLDIETPGESQYHLCTEISRPPGGVAHAFSLWLAEVCERASQWPRGLPAQPE
ncbi:LysR substrate-binding domain-containing protein, partial [Achromobacter ruhlandii]|uniref:LysR substrate-binding domain-containing protein n=1 Tax=Achromobacter ruhlandii TaxID=72557 RepID=UPI002015E813